MISLIVALALVGFVVWVLTTQVPMPSIFKTGIWVITAVCVLFYLMRVLHIGDIPLP